MNKEDKMSHTTFGRISMATKVYINIRQQSKLTKTQVELKDVCSIHSSDKGMIEKIGHIQLDEFNMNRFERRTYDILLVISLIEDSFPEIEIINLGETKFVVDYHDGKERKVLNGLKVAAVCGLCFIGSAYGIVAYNNDVGTLDIFSRIYKTFGAEGLRSSRVCEVLYSVGLFLGIVIFYNHFAGKNLAGTPTPLEIEMNKYENDVVTTVIEGSKVNEK